MVRFYSRDGYSKLFHELNMKKRWGGLGKLRGLGKISRAFFAFVWSGNKRMESKNLWNFEQQDKNLLTRKRCLAIFLRLTSNLCSFFLDLGKFAMEHFNESKDKFPQVHPKSFSLQFRSMMIAFWCLWQGSPTCSHPEHRS